MIKKSNLYNKIRFFYVILLAKLLYFNPVNYNEA